MITSLIGVITGAALMVGGAAAEAAPLLGMDTDPFAPKPVLSAALKPGGDGMTETKVKDPIAPSAQDDKTKPPSIDAPEPAKPEPVSADPGMESGDAKLTGGFWFASDAK